MALVIGAVKAARHKAAEEPAAVRDCRSNAGCAWISCKRWPIFCRCASLVHEDQLVRIEARHDSSMWCYRLPLASGRARLSHSLTIRSALAGKMSNRSAPARDPQRTSTCLVRDSRPTVCMIPWSPIAPPCCTSRERWSNPGLTWSRGVLQLQKSRPSNRAASAPPLL